MKPHKEVARTCPRGSERGGGMRGGANRQDCEGQPRKAFHSQEGAPSVFTYDGTGQGTHPSDGKVSFKGKS